MSRISFGPSSSSVATDEVDFRDYTGGLVGAAAGDVTAAFTLAASQLAPAGVGLYIPRGTWVFDTASTPGVGQPNFKVRGAGRQTILQAGPNRSSGTILNFSSCDHHTVRDLTFDGNNRPLSFLFLASGDDCKFQDNYTRGNPFSAFAVKLTYTNGRVLRNTVEQSDRDGLEVGGSGNLIGWNIFVADLVNGGSGDDCMGLWGLDQSLVIGNIFNNPNHARGRCIAGSSWNEVAIVGNFFRYGYRAFILIQDAPAVAGVPQPTDGVLIEDNVGVLAGYRQPVLSSPNMGDFIQILSTVTTEATMIRRIVSRGNNFKTAARHGFVITSQDPGGTTLGNAGSIVEEIDIDDTYYDDVTVAGAIAVPLVAASGSGGNAIRIVGSENTGTVRNVRIRDPRSYTGFPGAGGQINYSGANVQNVSVGPDHGNLAGLANDDHLQYLLLAGRAGGQTAIGGLAATVALTLKGSATPLTGKGTVDILDRLRMLGALTSSGAPMVNTVGNLNVIDMGASFVSLSTNNVASNLFRILHAQGTFTYTLGSTGNVAQVFNFNGTLAFAAGIAAIGSPKTFLGQMSIAPDVNTAGAMTQHDDFFSFLTLVAVTQPWTLADHKGHSAGGVANAGWTVARWRNYHGMAPTGAGVLTELVHFDGDDLAARGVLNLLLRGKGAGDQVRVAGQAVFGDLAGAGVAPPPTAASAGLELQSINRAVLLSRMTGAQMNALAGAVDGMVVYVNDNATVPGPNFYKHLAGAWVIL